MKILDNDIPVIFADKAAKEVVKNANWHILKKPTKDMLLEEIAELLLALRGKHQHTPREELVEIGGIAINLIRAIDMGYDIS